MVAIPLAPGQAEEPVLYPQGFREWVHVKSALITSSHPAWKPEGGLHHIYANGKAVEGYRTGEFPDGSVIVYELLETREKDGVISEGGRRRVDVMVRNARQYATTGGWHYERFLGNNNAKEAITDSDRATCLNCHARQKEHAFVFSRMR